MPVDKPRHGLFITGTSTEVGKTYVACLIAKSLLRAGYRVGVYKPVASGCRRMGEDLVSDDAISLWEAAGRPLTPELVCPQLFEAALAPHLAARAEHKEIDTIQLHRGIEPWHGKCDVLLVEGAGGLMSPLGDEQYNATLAEDLGYPLIVVAPNTLGVINQTLQTLITATAFGDGLAIAGIVLNDIRNEQGGHDASRSSNRRELASRCVPPVLTEVQWCAEQFAEEIDWFSLSKPINGS